MNKTLQNLFYGICLLICMAACEDKDLTGEIYQEIRSADKMVFASMAVTKTAKLEDSEWYKIGKRIAVYSYDSYLRAYINLSQLTADDMVFDDKTKTVSLILPPVQTEVIGRDMEFRKEYENIGPLRSDIDAKERAQMKEIANTSFRKEIQQNPIFNERLTQSAQRKARLYFESLLKQHGYTATITFRQ